MFELVDNVKQKMNVTVIGIGTVGCKIVKSINIFDDNGSEVFNKLYLHSSKETLDLLSGDESEKIHVVEHPHFIADQLTEKISGQDILFIVAGLGGESGSNISPFVARIAKSLNVLSVGLFSFPFQFEGRGKISKASRAYSALSANMDSLICIENEKFFGFNMSNNSIVNPEDLFNDSNKHFEAVINSLVSLVAKPGMINVDFEDIKLAISNMGRSIVGVARQGGELRAENAVKKVLESPDIKGSDLLLAKCCIVCITKDLDMSLGEFNDVGDVVENIVSEDAMVIVGTVIDLDIRGEMEVTVILTGLPELELDQNYSNEYFDIIEVSKSIIFEPYQVGAGLSILTYFSEFLRQKYENVEAKVRIEQDKNLVRLIVETSSGQIDCIERSLHEFGLVVVGQKQARDILNNELDAERLNMKLEIAALELRHSQKFLKIYELEIDQNKKRIGSLEDQLLELQSVIFNSLENTQSELFRTLNNNSKLSKKLIGIIKRSCEDGFDDSAKETLEQELLKASDDSLISLRKLAESSVSGVVGNSVFTFIIHFLNSFPK
mgnify:CR=1 FL=1